MQHVTTGDEVPQNVAQKIGDCIEKYADAILEAKNTEESLRSYTSYISTGVQQLKNFLDTGFGLIEAVKQEDEEAAMNYLVNATNSFLDYFFPLSAQQADPSEEKFQQLFLTPLHEYFDTITKKAQERELRKQKARALQEQQERAARDTLTAQSQEALKQEATKQLTAEGLDKEGAVVTSINTFAADLAAQFPTLVAHPASHGLAPQSTITELFIHCQKLIQDIVVAYKRIEEYRTKLTEFLGEENTREYVHEYHAKISKHALSELTLKKEYLEKHVFTPLKNMLEDQKKFNELISTRVSDSIIMHDFCSFAVCSASDLLEDILPIVLQNTQYLRVDMPATEEEQELFVAQRILPYAQDLLTLKIASCILQEYNKSHANLAATDIHSKITALKATIDNILEQVSQKVESDRLHDGIMGYKIEEESQRKSQTLQIKQQARLLKNGFRKVSLLAEKYFEKKDNDIDTARARAQQSLLELVLAIKRTSDAQEETQKKQLNAIAGELEQLLKNKVDHIKRLTKLFLRMRDSPPCLSRSCTRTMDTLCAHPTYKNGCTKSKLWHATNKQTPRRN
jgi:hypothetical protein